MSGNSGLVEKLKQMDSIARSGIIEIPLQVTWSIPNFLEAMHRCESTGRGPDELFNIPIIGGREKADVHVKVTYRPNIGHIWIEGKVKVPSWIGYIFGHDITFRLLDRTGSERMYRNTSFWTRPVMVDFKGFLEKKVLLAHMDNLLPDGQLTILIKGKIFALAKILAATCTNPDWMCQKENTMCDVKLDTFVDLGSDSVLLVFEDGEERCHTFLLAAR
jgi:hypothetical protein